MPRIQTTRMVRIALICLRIYLVVMLALIIAKFVGNCSAAGKSIASAAGGANAPSAVSSTNAPAAGSPHL